MFINHFEDMSFLKLYDRRIITTGSYLKQNTPKFLTFINIYEIHLESK